MCRDRMPNLLVVSLLAFLCAGYGGCAMGGNRYLVSTPTPCQVVERVEGNRVYLRSTGRICIQSLGSLPVQLDRKYQAVEIYTDGRLWNTVTPVPQ
jgi:hypothetical protein